MSEHLFLFSINPVQSFIEQARKTKDLYAGSSILSGIIGDEIKKIQREFKGRFIFPSHVSSQAPNRFLVVIDTDDPKKLGGQIRDDILASFKKRVAGSISTSQNDVFMLVFNKQADTFLNVSWVAAPYSKEGFAGAYAELEENLRGVRNLRIFEQHVQNPGKKCDLCGERNSIFFGSAGSSSRDNINYDGTIEGLDPREGLCAVCYMKRSAKTGERGFPSTAKIASMDTLERLKREEPESVSLIEEYIYFFTPPDFDEQLLYEKNLTKQYFEKQGLSKYLNRLPEIKSKNRKLRDLLAKHKLKLPRYYAIVKLDGDSMGEWLSGKNLNSKAILEQFNTEISHRLSNYANDIENRFKEWNYWGKLVYAGGDDLLAFVNLNGLSKILVGIREAFPSFSKIQIDGKNVVKSGKESSASCGVAIAHYKTPLSEVLKWARKMEHEAKAIGSEKDACSIVILKRSGDITKTSFKWNFDSNGRTLQTMALFGSLLSLLNKNDVSTNFITNLDKEFSLLCDKNEKFNEDAIVKDEIARLIKRTDASGPIKKTDEMKKQIDSAIDDLINFYLSDRRMDNFLSFLRIIRFVNREVSCDN